MHKTHIHTKHMYMCKHMHPYYTYTQNTHTYIHTHTHIDIQTHAYTHIYTQKHTYTYIKHIYIHTHTHTQAISTEVWVRVYATIGRCLRVCKVLRMQDNVHWLTGRKAGPSICQKKNFYSEADRRESEWNLQ